MPIPIRDRENTRTKPKGHTRYWGIDPGGTGGIAIIQNWRVYQYPLPETERDTWNLIRSHSAGGKDRVCIEWITPGMYGINKSAGAKLYASYLSLRAFLIAASVPFEDIKPKAWQKALSIPPRKKTEDTRKWKNRLRAKAQELFPELDVWDKTKGEQLAVADALLIAEFCKRLHAR